MYLLCFVRATCLISAMHIHWETLNVTVTVQLNVTTFNIIKKKKEIEIIFFAELINNVTHNSNYVISYPNIDQLIKVLRFKKI